MPRPLLLVVSEILDDHSSWGKGLPTRENLLPVLLQRLPGTVLRMALAVNHPVMGRTVQ